MKSVQKSPYIFDLDLDLQTKPRIDCSSVNEINFQKITSIKLKLENLYDNNDDDSDRVTNIKSVSLS